MIKETKIITKTCDICKKEVEEFTSVSETYGESISKLEISIWYGETKKKDICRTCDTKILRFMKSLNTEL